MLRFRLTIAAIFGLLVFFTPAVPARGNPHSASAPSSAEKHRFFPEARKVFWTGVVTLKVTSFDQARENVVALANRHGGSSYNEAIHVDKAGRKFGNITIRVPENQRYDFLREARALGTLYSQKITAPDLTEEFIDLDRRVRNLRAEEDQLVQILRQARHVLEVLQVQEHLFNVRVEIERITSRRGEIDLKSQGALFALQFFEAPPVTAPVLPGGVAEFLPRWWTFTAQPLVKREARRGFYNLSEAWLLYALGLRDGLPNLLYALLGTLVILIFWRKAWPTHAPQFRSVVDFLKSSEVAAGPLLWSLLFVYVCSRLLSHDWALAVFSFLFMLWALGLVRSPRGVGLCAVLQARGVAPTALYFAVCLPLLFSLMRAFAPDLWSGFFWLLTWSGAAVMLVLALPRMARAVQEMALRGLPRPPVVGDPMTGGGATRKLATPPSATETMGPGGRRRPGSSGAQTPFKDQAPGSVTRSDDPPRG